MEQALLAFEFEKRYCEEIVNFRTVDELKICSVNVADVSYMCRSGLCSREHMIALVAQHSRQKLYRKWSQNTKVAPFHVSRFGDFDQFCCKSTKITIFDEEHVSQFCGGS